MEPQGVFVLSEPGLLGPNNVLRPAYNMPPLCNALIYTEEQYAPHQYARAYNMSPQGLYNGLIFTLMPSVIVQRATNEANYPKEPRAVVGDALTYIQVWPDCPFGQPT